MREGQNRRPLECYASVSKDNGFPNRDEALEGKLADFYNSLPHLPYEGHTGEIDNYLTALEQGQRP